LQFNSKVSVTNSHATPTSLDITNFFFLSSVAEDFEEIYSIPIRVICNKDAVFQGSTGDNDWWHIPRNDVEIIEKLGGGASAAVFLSSLYGAQGNSLSLSFSLLNFESKE
jgi:hypothetical protein